MDPVEVAPIDRGSLMNSFILSPDSALIDVGVPQSFITAGTVLISTTKKRETIDRIDELVTVGPNLRSLLIESSAVGSIEAGALPSTGKFLFIISANTLMRWLTTNRDKNWFGH